MSKDKVVKVHYLCKLSFQEFYFHQHKGALLLIDPSKTWICFQKFAD